MVGNPSQKVAFNPDRAVFLAEMLKAIAHPLRLRIIGLLCLGDRTVSDMITALDAAQATVSQQLRILRMAGLVDVARTGGFATYRIAEPRLHELVRCIEGCHRGPGQTPN